MIRSFLFVPGDDAGKQAKAMGCGADALILDLEDSVAPAAKRRAREVVAATLAAHGSIPGPELWVRVNPLDGDLTVDDLEAVLPRRPAGIVLPKCNHGRDVEHLSALLRPLEAANDIPDEAVRILPIITETAAGVLAAGTYGDRTNRLLGLTWGAEDLAADLGAREKRGNDGRYRDVFRHARVQTLLAARAAGVDAVDTVYPDFRDAEGFARECREAATDGFTAKMAIHPAQVEAINTAFTPSEADVAEAEAVVGAFEAAGDPGVLAVDGKMLDRPHLVHAQRTLARAQTVGRSSSKDDPSRP